MFDSNAHHSVTQAVRDGVIEAVINHEEGYMQSKEKVDVYMTGEPLAQYHQRVRFCLDIRNQSVRAMRYPPKSYSKDLETAEVSPFERCTNLFAPFLIFIELFLPPF